MPASASGLAVRLLSSGPFDHTSICWMDILCNFMCINRDGGVNGCFYRLREYDGRMDKRTFVVLA